jgi:hypothetical protein
MPTTIKIFGDDLPVIADLGQGFYLVRCFERTLAIGKPAEVSDPMGGMLSHPRFESEAVPAIVRQRAKSEIVKLTMRGVTAEAGLVET